MPLSAGDRLGPYEILAPIGKGGMGEVWKARDTRLNRIVAIKTSQAHFSERFEREARAVAALNHPNICTLHDVGRDYLVMEFLEGDPPKGPLPVQEVVRIGRQIASALEAAHERHITHRDLKPGNILLKSDGTVKVLDFGLAKMGGFAAAAASMSPEDSPTLTLAATQMGVILGTAAYMAPEQAKGKEVDKRADIWAFGVVLYELSTGRRPFHGEDMSEVLASVLKEHPSYEPLPHELRRLVRKCLEKDPAKRLRDIGDAWDLLDDAAPVVEEVPVPPKRSLLPWIAAGVMGVVALGLGYVAWQHSGEESPRLVKLEFLPPEGGSFNEGGGPPAISPDGRRVAFRAIVDGRDGLWVRDLDSLESKLLSNAEGIANPFWSPDSHQIGFFAQNKLLKVDATGGPVTTITMVSAPSRGGDWNRDGVILFGLQGPGILQVSAAGGAASVVTELDASQNEAEHVNPRFLPDGRHFLYRARSIDREKSAIYVGDLQSKEKKRVRSGDSLTVYASSRAEEGRGHLLFVREGTLMAQPFDADRLKTTGEAVPVAERVDYRTDAYGYFSASQNGALVYVSGESGTEEQITWYDRAGKIVGRVGKPGDIQAVRLSPNGKLIAMDRRDAATARFNIWLLDLVRGTEQRFTFEDNSRFPIWSPDGSHVAFLRGSNQEGKVVARATDDGGEDEVLVGSAQRPTEWTSQGDLISETLDSNPKTGSDIWLLHVGKEKREPIALRRTEFNEYHGRVSSDGRWLAYFSTETKRPEVYVTSFPSLKGRWQISVDGGRLPVWSRDGHELYFVGLGNKLTAVQIPPGPEFRPSVPKALFDLRLGTDATGYDVSSDGRFLIPAPVDQVVTVPMTVVLNWQALLKK